MNFATSVKQCGDVGVKEELFLELELEDNAEVDGGSIGNKSSHSSVSGSARYISLV